MHKLNEVYITRINTFFPNDPISNSEMEDVLGYAGGKPSRSRAIVLRSNGIKNRFYALDKSGKFNYSNAQLAAIAVEGLFDENITQDQMQLLACGTSSPDMLLPSLASMVHGELDNSGVELISATGACCSGTHALKYAYYSVLCGETTIAVSTGSERFSQYLMGSKFDAEMEDMKMLEDNPILAFEKDFLRWMLSDGAGAFLLQNKPEEGHINFKIEWIENTSFADQKEVCMYLGADKNGSDTLHSFGEMSTSEWGTKSVFAFKQDVRLLGENIVPLGAKWMKDVLAKRNIDKDSIDHFLPHLSSMFFWNKIVEELIILDMIIPESKWYVNLPEVGNVGAASAYAMLEGLNNSVKLNKGEKILIFVPESARFSYSMVYLTVC